ncbi:cytochrome P450 [Actinoallomurus iriomotensis]|uniref:Cytochrome P450 n=1 Tax=Actinoallomurus iriomotensis TaxID=478107 RepID=A0A9W6RQC1_9ACTN|nr:cytochrome P450 [Actinoallomurus iriomotensis]GLY79828.1 cytochrome P450 [Actinoallomurus iriomotensis]
MTDVSAVLGFDPFAPEFSADPYAHYRSLRAAGPLVHTAGGLWLSTSFAVCTQVLRDPRFGHGDTGPAGRPPRRRSFLTLDPPEHTRLRRLVSRAFTARLVERLRPRVSAIVDELLAGLDGEVDLIAGLAHPLPVIVISEMLGVPPEDEERFKDWSDALARGLDPDFVVPPDELTHRDQAREEFAEYFRELAARRRAAPGDDLLSGLVAIEELTEDDLIATCVLLLVAGHETTVNLIANGTLALLRSPDQLAWFRDHPDEAAAAVEELLRYDPPVQLSARVALEDAEIAGQRIGRGEPIMLLLGAANRDPEVFTDPDHLNLTRWLTEAPRHLAFGQGIHFCLGAPLARIEGQTALTALMRREVTLMPGPLRYKDNLILRGLAELPVRIS